MARPLRIESEDGVYHVLNRGNYRAPLFRSEKTKLAFLKCLGEACERTGWLVHAWAIMSNHYHLALSTPRANLVEGMRWLQGTFANRFNRFRDERGHVFQGRYKSLVVDPGEGLGPLCHYIHLNPVRARICHAAVLPHYPWTSLGWIVRPGARLPWFEPMPALRHAGELADTAAGARKYCEYLAWLAEDEPAQKAQKFASMSKGWIIGTRDFMKSMTDEHRELVGRGPQLHTQMQQSREYDWERALARELHRIGRSPGEVQAAGKSAPWKLELALALRRTTTVTNRWLGERLNLGGRDYVSRRLGALIKIVS
jgi:REP element-mobilizing transposase RayT